MGLRNYSESNRSANVVKWKAAHADISIICRKFDIFYCAIDRHADFTLGFTSEFMSAGTKPVLHCYHTGFSLHGRVKDAISFTR